MLVCGIKLTHDAAVAVMDEERLLFSVEVEKLNNNARYSAMPSLQTVEHILKREGIAPRDLGRVVIDGWKGGYLPRFGLRVAPYHRFDLVPGRMPLEHELDGRPYGTIGLEGRVLGYDSYTHMATHIVGSYASSPYAAARAKAYAITWDGGQNPRVHVVDPDAETPITHLTSLFGFYGIIYGIMGYYYGPYKKPEVMQRKIFGAADPLYGGYDIPGKLMSYIGLGRPIEKLIDAMAFEYDKLGSQFAPPDLGYHQNGIFEHEFMRAIRKHHSEDTPDADVLCSLHTFLERKLVYRARQLIPPEANLIFTGGSALNIKWNTALRESQHFSDVWVPPFPNDTGNAIGAAAAHRATWQNEWWLDWTAYAGPRLITDLPLGMQRERCPLQLLAKHLADAPDKPVVVLYGRAELGPRALGHRSIIAAATSANMKAKLNELKGRETFRPVAPICLEEFAPQIFSPGTPDPYMLFDHEMRPEWREKIPAVLHIDNTARLQTIGKDSGSSKVVRALLEEYHRLTGIPVLCNTSANENGAGFFPDIASAVNWATQRGVRVWAEGYFYSRA